MAFEEYMALAKYKERHSQSNHDDPELEMILQQQLMSNKAKMLRTRREQEESIRQSLKLKTIGSPMVLLNTRDILDPKSTNSSNPLIQVNKKQINLRYGSSIFENKGKKDQSISPRNMGSETHTPVAGSVILEPVLHGRPLGASKGDLTAW